ncbi:MAG: hypothetical protein MK179_07665 [Pirellulaceae bacterium]|nr:hypothetical protein [Pirellulaceae bacterium]
MFDPSSNTPFVFAGCQRGAENALKTDLLAQQPDLRFAFSRPGFLTFKLPAPTASSTEIALRSAFLRCTGRTCGKATAENKEDLLSHFTQFLEAQTTRAIHVWHRQAPSTDTMGYAHQQLDATVSEIVSALSNLPTPPTVNTVAQPGTLIANCIVVEPLEWWFGTHVVRSVCDRWPGGVYPGTLPESAVSRAYLKLAEALAWSRMPVRKQDLCVELGSAPGGASQLLLERGLRVVGVDPAEMHPDVMAHPNFQHRRCRGRDLKRREFRGVRWLVVDSNVAPGHSLDTVEDIVTHRLVSIHGMLLTLKLLDWNLAEELPELLKRIRGWGYGYVKARQLSHAGQEICVFALRRRGMLRAPRTATKRSQRS